MKASRDRRLLLALRRLMWRIAASHASLALVLLFHGLTVEGGIGEKLGGLLEVDDGE
jgi:hypothetical protein